MPSANPIVEGIPGRGPVAASAPTADSAPPTSAPRMRSLGSLAGFSSPDNTSTHCAVIVAVALGVVVFLYFGGFKFAVDAGVTR
jgi:hypothetical protein